MDENTGDALSIRIDISSFYYRQNGIFCKGSEGIITKNSIAYTTDHAMKKRKKEEEKNERTSLYLDQKFNRHLALMH